MDAWYATTKVMKSIDEQGKIDSPVFMVGIV